MILETEKLILRKFRETDLDDFYAYARDRDVGPSAGWKPHANKEESREILEKFMHSADLFAMEFKETGKVIGSVGFHEDKKRDFNEVLMIGYALAKPYWGRGIMVEGVHAMLDYAFKKLEVRIVSAYHYPFNLQSKRVLEKTGFTYEGTLKMASLLPNGTIVDDVCYAITKKEYFDALKKAKNQE